MNNQVTIVLEFNCYEPSHKATVWFFPSKLGAAPVDVDELTTLDGAQRILGPVDQEVAMKLYESLKRVFASTGIDCTGFEIADD